MGIAIKGLKSPSGRFGRERNKTSGRFGRERNKTGRRFGRASDQPRTRRTENPNVRPISNDDRQNPEQDRSVTSLVASVARLAACAGGSSEESAEAIRGAMDQADAAERRIAELIGRLGHVERLALTDELSGLLNRRGFEAELKRAMQGARRYREQGVLIYVDLDAFKPINDTFGHAAGDAVLRRVSNLLSENVRGTDFVGRLGGDEFAVLLTRTTWEAGLKRAEAFDEMLNNTFVDWLGRAIAVSASLGFQTYGPDDDLTEILNAADNAMYETKRARTDTQPSRASA